MGVFVKFNTNTKYNMRPTLENSSSSQDGICSVENKRNLLKKAAHVNFSRHDLIITCDKVPDGTLSDRVSSSPSNVTNTQSKSSSSLLGYLLPLRSRSRKQAKIQTKIVMSSQGRRSSFPSRKKSDATKIPALKGLQKKGISKSPSLPKKHPVTPSQDAVSAATPKPRSGSNLGVPYTDDQQQMLRSSTEDLDSVEVSSRENGSSGEGGMDEMDGPTPTDSHSHDPLRTKTAIEQTQSKIRRTMEMIKAEQAAKEENVNEYLKLAASTGADKQQLQRIKTMFEKKNQKSTQTISHLQKKLENYHKRLSDLETYGVSGHKQAREVLRDMGQGLKPLLWRSVWKKYGSRSSWGVVDNIKGAKDTIVSKPKEFAHLIKNKFGSAGDISELKIMDEVPSSEGEKIHGSTLPARYCRSKSQPRHATSSLIRVATSPGMIAVANHSQAHIFKYGSDDDNSSITSGSGFGAHSSPPSVSQNTSQQLPILTQASLDPVVMEMKELRDSNVQMQETIQSLIKELDVYRVATQSDLSIVKTFLEEERYRVERLEEQINDMTELHQNEVTNLRQDISSMEEKIEYRLDERTGDLHESLENCQTRVSKMELQQQQQQIISMEMVDNVTFRTLLTKLINVVLALLAVVLVFVSTAANLVAPFLTTRARILSTVVLIFALVLVGQNWGTISTTVCNIWNYIVELLPRR
ncbi:transmembrane and coiled-coil domains protein 1-like isoform X2 [Pecten maximus]|uniref:transmembrane and coiled-coil domains protein 1-like isoform X2 n=1 Tax=Pecten maximus TaxID=6579 RepID=UPI001458E614|nr:transmembrane and coiled-coil domains protein 1-like isoform X2 [Pecten maximus]